MLCPPSLPLGALGLAEPIKPPAPHPAPAPPTVPSLGLCPVPHRPARLTMMQLGLLMDHRLTRQSSPPVASSRPEALPSTSEDTLLAWATISSIQGRTGGEGSQRASLGHGEEGRALTSKAPGPGTRSPGGRVHPLRLPSGARHPGTTQKPGCKGRPCPRGRNDYFPTSGIPVPPSGRKVCSFFCTSTSKITMLPLLNLKQ